MVDRQAANAQGVEPLGWGTAGLRRATITLALAQLLSWGALFYGFGTVAPAITAETGWSTAVVAGAFSVGLLVSGLAAPGVARALGTRDPRSVLAAGSAVGIAGMLLFATATSIPFLYLAWIVIGLAMAATLYEPAVVVLVALDPARRRRSLTTLTVIAGLASTAFSPLGSWLTEGYGWRPATAILGVSAGVVTLVLHAGVLPPVRAAIARADLQPSATALADPRVRRLRAAVVLEQGAIVASGAHLIGLLVAGGVSLGTAGLVLGAVGIGKVPGRLLLLGPILRFGTARLAAGCNLLLLAALAVPLLSTTRPVLLAAGVTVGVASGPITVLRSLLLVELVGVAPFAAVSARLQRATTMARAGAPLALGALVTVAGWTWAWWLLLAALAAAAERYFAASRT
jgi:predicted MFS family arabinose efflux permease